MQFLTKWEYYCIISIRIKGRKIKMIEHFNLSDFDQIFEIMENSFPLTEYRTYDEQKALWSNPYYKVVGVRKDGKIIAFLAMWDLENVLFLEHLATTPECRNGGIGRHIIREVLDSTDKLVCLEVEHPDDDLTKRRVEFYKRNGMFLNEYDYIQPAISHGREPIPLYIMTSRAPINESTYNEIKSTIYKTVYGIED